MPTNDTDYSCHIKAVKLVNQSCGVHIMPLVITSLGADTHTLCRQDQFLESRRMLASGWHVPGLQRKALF